MSVLVDVPYLVRSTPAVREPLSARQLARVVLEAAVPSAAADHGLPVSVPFWATAGTATGRKRPLGRLPVRAVHDICHGLTLLPLHQLRRRPGHVLAADEPEVALHPQSNTPAACTTGRCLFGTSFVYYGGMTTSS